MTDGFTLHLRQVPPGLMVDLLAAIDGFHREVQVAGLGNVALDDRDRLAQTRNTVHDQAVAARAAGLDRIDITTTYRDGDLASSRSAATAVGEAHEAARRGEMLSAPLTPAQHQLWTWVRDQIEAQAAGEEPTPFVLDGDRS